MSKDGTNLGGDALIVLHGFFALNDREKMKAVEAMNEYLDSSEKERVRAAYDERFESLNVIAEGIDCKCCGRK